MNEHEARARSVKAYKIVRVLERIFDERPDLADGDPHTIPHDLRLRLAKVAKVRPPSERTWDVVCDLLNVRRTQQIDLPEG